MSVNMTMLVDGTAVADLRGFEAMPLPEDVIEIASLVVGHPVPAEAISVASVEHSHFTCEVIVYTVCRVAYTLSGDEYDLGCSVEDALDELSGLDLHGVIVSQDLCIERSDPDGIKSPVTEEHFLEWPAVDFVERMHQLGFQP